jgi:hypothetical protein
MIFLTTDIYQESSNVEKGAWRFIGDSNGFVDTDSSGPYLSILDLEPNIKFKEF